MKALEDPNNLDAWISGAFLQHYPEAMEFLIMGVSQGESSNVLEHYSTWLTLQIESQVEDS